MAEREPPEAVNTSVLKSWLNITDNEQEDNTEAEVCKKSVRLRSRKQWASAI